MIKSLLRITTNLFVKKQFTKRKLKNSIYKKSTTKILRDQQVKKEKEKTKNTQHNNKIIMRLDIYNIHRKNKMNI